MCACHTTFAAACDHNGGCWEQHGDCTGCETAPAQFGLLCFRCDRTLRDLLGDRESPEGPHGFGWIYEHLGNNLDPPVRGMSFTRGGGDESPVPIRLEVVDLQFTIADALRLWMEEAIQSVPHARLTGPQILSAGSITRWMLAHVDVLEAAPFAGELVTALDEMSGEAHRCAPWRAAPKLLRGIPCPYCHTTALRIPGGEVDVTCGHCGGFILRAHYTAWTAALADTVRPDARKRTASA